MGKILCLAKFKQNYFNSKDNTTVRPDAVQGKAKVKNCPKKDVPSQTLLNKNKQNC